MSLDINHFKEIIVISYKKLAAMPDNEASVKETSSKWSPKEILGHLIDSSNINLNRFLHSLHKGDLVFEKYPQDEYVKIQKYNEQEWTHLLKLWKLNNLHIINLIENISPARLEKLTYAHNFDQICSNKVTENQKSNLEYLINDYFDHLEHHLKQIFNKIKE